MCVSLLPGLRATAGFLLMAWGSHSVVAEGSLESAWLLPLPTPVTNHVLPLEPLPKAFWEMAPLCQVLQWLFKGGNVLLVSV